MNRSVSLLAMALRKYGMARRGRGKRTYKRRATTRRSSRKSLSKPQAAAVRRIAKRVSYKLGPRIALESAPASPAVYNGDLKGVNPLGFKFVTSSVNVNDVKNTAQFFNTTNDEMTGSASWWTNTKIQLTYKMRDFDSTASASFIPDLNAKIHMHVYLVSLKRGFPAAAFDASTGAIALAPQVTHTQRYDHCLLNTEYFDIHASRKVVLGYDNALQNYIGNKNIQNGSGSNEKTLYFYCPRNFRLNNVAGNWRDLQYCPAKTRNYYVLTFMTIPDGTDNQNAGENYSVEYNWMVTHKLRHLG